MQSLAVNQVLTKLRTACWLLLALSAIHTLQAHAGNAEYAAYGTPVGHDKYMVLMANGRYNPTDTNYQAPDYDHFTRDIMGWDDQQITAFEQRAQTFFRERFGVDVTAADLAGRVMMVPFMLDPRWEYRLYNSSGEQVPPEGWVVRDGGYQLVVVDPAGIDLGGEFLGQHAAPGAVAAFGKFNISRGPGNSHRHDDLVIHYQSREPVLHNSGFPLHRTGTGALIAPFEVFHPDYGAGWGFAHIFEQNHPDGRRQTNNRNVMTFPSGAAYPDWLKTQ